MSEWKRCGEGFHGVHKFKHVLDDFGDYITTRNKKMGDSECVIVNDTTPDGKRKAKRSKGQDGIVEQGGHHVKSIRSFTHKTWKEEDFLEGFSVSKDGSSQKSDEISWSSSSDEGLPSEYQAHKKNRATRALERAIGKQYSPETDTDTSHCSNKSASLPAQEQLNSGSETKTDNCLRTRPLTTVGTEGQNITEVSKTSSDSRLCASMSQSRPTFQLTPHTKRYKPNESSWATTLFDDFRQSGARASVAGACKSKSLHGARCKSSGKHFKSTAARRLDVGGSEEASGQISDVESDSETEKSDKVAADHDGKILSRVDHSCEDREFVVQHCQETLLEEYSPFSSQCSEVSISTDTSSSCSTSSEKMKASDWVMALKKQRTPVKGDEWKSCQIDSDKKKRRLARGSLADQLARVVSREKASIRFWYHSVRNGSFDEKSNKSLLMKLQWLEKQFSLLVAQCDVLEDSVSTSVCRAVFTRETVDKLSLKPGMTVRVFPPWQQLEENGGMRTVLCTHYIQVVSNPNEEASKREVQDGRECHFSVSAVWTCPCSRDPTVPSHACPATLCPVAPHQTSQLGVHPATASVMLQTVSAVPHHLFDVPVSRRTLLDCLQAAGGDNTFIQPFTASVLRVFRYRLRGTLKQKFQLLIEDLVGTLAVVNVCEELPDALKAVCNVVGKACTFSQLRVASRTHRDKEPDLFRIVDQAWTQRFLHCSSQQRGGDASQSKIQQRGGDASQSQIQQRGGDASQSQIQQSGSDTSQSQLPAATPSFAYILNSAASLDYTFAVEQDDCDRKVPFVKLMSLQEVVQSLPGCRVSFIARVLIPAGLKQATGSRYVFVYDLSVVIGGVTEAQRVELGSECVLDDDDTDDAVYFFRDALLDKEHIICDRYTLVVGMLAWKSWGLHKVIEPGIVASIRSCVLTLPLVSHKSRPGDLVSIEGNISGVDENLAYSWEECNRCGNDRLVTMEESGISYCTMCNRQVASPVTRIKMEVFVTCSSVPSDLIVKVDLTEMSIERLLPAGPSEEGYDIEQVISKPLRCPACLVQHGICNSSADQHTETKPSLLVMELKCSLPV